MVKDKLIIGGNIKYNVILLNKKIFYFKGELRTWLARK